MIAKYKCMKCKYRWEGKAGPIICPRCSHVYIRWINVQEILDQIELKKYFKF